ncbi:MAG: phosphate signaling complex protein PhoU [Magnetococcales bacterium]|nr:phosphate signaling complex protein PhoU [Magnetococcales bacterium]NGZ07171.1 phosphate signaling complex protein PhoU [Magnetococcales bacterium]
MAIYEKRLQQDLEQIRLAVSSMGNGVETALKNAMQALLTGNEVLANMTILQDYPLDRQCQELDRMCHSFIARHLPSAGHLRLISSSMRMIYELERVADYAVNICREALDLQMQPTGLIRQELESMANNSRTMLRQALTAFVDENAGLARSTMEMNVQLGTSLAQAFDDLIEEGDTHSGHSRELMDTYVIFTMLERVGNRATNLCEEIIFWLTGELPTQKPIRILFLDEENSSLSLLAEAMARKGYDRYGSFASAGRRAACDKHPYLGDFLRTMGMDHTDLQPKSLDSLDVDTFDLILGLQGTVRSYIPRPPFHTAFLNWDLGELPDLTDPLAAKRRFEEIYRELAVHLRQLLELLVGREVL